MINFLNSNYSDLEKVASINNKKYENAEPFPNIVFDNFFNENILNKILENFPSNLQEIGNENNTKAEKKLSLNDPSKFSHETNNFINYLNSAPFVKFLNKLTGIDETLITDPYLIGGGLHELRNDGYLNVHADFNQHPSMKLDRRLNILIYLNKNWSENNGGQLELWDKKMANCIKNILPVFNRMVVFSTTDFSYHGNPNKVKVENNLSRKSIAMYYYSNGRPSSERQLGLHSTIFRKRPGTDDVDGNLEFKKLFGKLYFKTKKKVV
tara:strand:+ start:183 stop:983 length:801 start_codon:yes stop_codon:yes gene_type:complete